MRTSSLVLIALLLGSPAFAADPVASDPLPQFRGLLVAGADRQFSLVAPGRAAPQWVKLGGTFDGWEVADFKAADETLTLKKGARTVALRLEGSSVANAPTGAGGAKATLAEAEEVLQKMDFERMMSRMMDQQKASMINMTRQMGRGAGANAANQEEIAAFQKKTMDVLFEAMNFSEMKGDMARVYSETFTHDELRGLSEFYSTPAGQALVEKQPEIAQKINNMIMPRMMAAMPKIQEMGKQFAAEQAAKRAAAAEAAAVQAAPLAPVTPAAPAK